MAKNKKLESLTVSQKIPFWSPGQIYILGLILGHTLNVKKVTLCDHLIYFIYTKKIDMKYNAHQSRNDHKFSPVCFDQT